MELAPNISETYTFQLIAFTENKLRRNYVCPNKDNDLMFELTLMIADLNHGDQ